LKLRLTSSGRALLHGSGPLAVIAEATFTPVGARGRRAQDVHPPLERSTASPRRDLSQSFAYIWPRFVSTVYSAMNFAPDNAEEPLQTPRNPPLFPPL
jgi:hypothetical protein